VSRCRIVAAGRVVDGEGSLTAVEDRWEELRRHGARLTELIIDPLEAGWTTPLAPNHFRSGCAPIEALAQAIAFIGANQVDAVLIRGEDCLRTRYANDKALRRRLMAIYGEECSIPEAYTQLAYAFMARHDITVDEFRDFAAALFESYRRTAQRHGAYTPPRPEAFGMVTDLFRAVDCANPVVDFAGAVIVAAEQFTVSPSVAVLGVGLGAVAGDGPEAIPQIVTYDHLRQACQDAASQAALNLRTEFRAGRLLLEAYTCFPVVPLAFLLASAIVDSTDEIMPLLAEHEITVTGGMNLARAPWNNPTLNALIVMFERLTSAEAMLGAVHGNGGLGCRQGLAILQSGR
jgi:hypothetical protein